jgi:hypothetical protein
MKKMESFTKTSTAESRRYHEDGKRFLGLAEQCADAAHRDPPVVCGLVRVRFNSDL